MPATTALIIILLLLALIVGQPAPPRTAIIEDAVPLASDQTLFQQPGSAD